MDDYIKREVILDPKVCKGINCEECPFAEGPLCKLRTYILHTAPSADVPSAKHWIPVSEKLPGKEGWYLVTDDSGGVQWLEVEHYNPEFGLEPFCTIQNPVAWMGLPEPWGGESE